MTDLRAELLELANKIPDEYLFGAVEALKFFSTTKAPFYLNANQKHLRESISEFERGKFKEHELIRQENFKKNKRADKIH